MRIAIDSVRCALVKFALGERVGCAPGCVRAYVGTREGGCALARGVYAGTDGVVRWHGGVCAEHKCTLVQRCVCRARWRRGGWTCVRSSRRRRVYECGVCGVLREQAWRDSEQGVAWCECTNEQCHSYVSVKRVKRVASVSQVVVIAQTKACVVSRLGVSAQTKVCFCEPVGVIGQTKVCV